jgi:glycosyltransferase involved in cell wall biosynthesis
MLSTSIVMATYNGGKFIKEQLRSLALQTLLPLEVVIVDDGSNDNTTDIIAEFSREAPFPVHLHHNAARLGYRGNFMRAAGLAQADLIAFCDQDDIWAPRKIELCAAAFDNPNVLLAYHDAHVITTEGAPLGRLERRRSPQTINPPTTTDPWLCALGFTQVFRRSLTNFSDLRLLSQDHNNQTEHMAHDQWFFFLASSLGFITYIEEPLASYRQHGGNLFGWEGKTTQTRGDKFKTLFLRHPERYRHLSEAAARRADILLGVGRRAEGDLAAQALDSADRYRNLEAWLANRRRLYSAPDLWGRLKAFSAILGSGGYAKSDSWSFGPKSLLKDAAVGLVSPPTRPAAAAP